MCCCLLLRNSSGVFFEWGKEKKVFLQFFFFCHVCAIRVNEKKEQQGEIWGQIFWERTHERKIFSGQTQKKENTDWWWIFFEGKKQHTQQGKKNKISLKKNNNTRWRWNVNNNKRLWGRERKTRKSHHRYVFWERRRRTSDFKDERTEKKTDDLGVSRFFVVGCGRE